MTKPNGIEVWQGASWQNGAPIVAILTGLQAGSANTKTGSMLQLWILSASADPIAAHRSGADSAICGECPYRGEFDLLTGAYVGGRACYVNLGQAPLAIWRAWRRGAYPRATLAETAEQTAGRKIRLGAYGDPGFLPVEILRACASRAALHTGYSHQWRDSRAAGAREFCMASTGSSQETAEAVARGWRAFEVTTEPTPRSVTCPASAEAGKVTTCASCGLCSGMTRSGAPIGKSVCSVVTIAPHGSGAKYAQLTISK